jgi:predicted metal-dependent peptidase
VHLLQCDTGVSRDDTVAPGELATYEIAGFGGSDMSPALNHLARDTEVEAALVLTDGYIDYPQETQPYQVLWVILGSSVPDCFTPLYGDVILMRR